MNNAGGLTPDAPDAYLDVRIGPYRIVRVVGRGGMGIVYEAIHESIGQRIAVKVLAESMARRPDYFERFVNEARAACAVHHPGLIHVFDFGRMDDGTPYILMEYVDGEPLRSRMMRVGRFPVQAAVRLARQIASTLNAIHARGIVHRDVKPENVILVPDEAADGGERAKLIDFGIAREADTAPQSLPGSLLGTPAYMAPEQCTDGDTTPASDVYSLGVLLFELLAGAPPFEGDAASVMRMQVLGEAPLARVAEVPEPLQRALAAMLAKDPAERPSAAAIAGRLLGGERPSVVILPQAFRTTEPSVRPFALSGSPTEDGPERVAKRRRPWVAGVVAVAGLSLAGVAFRAAYPPKTPAALPLTSMVRFQGGTFTIGRTPAESDAECRALGSECRREVLERAWPAHPVTVSPFYFDIHEATNEDFAQWLRSLSTRLEEDHDTHEKRYVMETRSGTLLADLHPAMGGIDLDDGGRFRARPGQQNKAVVQITWDGARAFCAAQGKRLPTEAEWEFAARGQTSRAFPWGDEPPTCDGTLFGRYDHLPCDGLPRGPTSVGASPQDHTPEGIADLAGNVSEWVEDAFISPHYFDCGSCENPIAKPADGASDISRVIRGGAWSNSILSRTSARGRWPQKNPATFVGVRCAANAE